MLKKMHLNRRRALAIITLGLVGTLVIPPTYVESENPSLLVEVTGKVWKGTAVVKIENSMDNIYDIKLVWLTLQNGAISSFEPMEGWSAEIGSNPETIQFRAETNPIEPGEAVKFGIKSDQSEPIFKWIILDDDGDELGSGVLDVARSTEEAKIKEEELLKKEQELLEKEQELLKKEQELLEKEKELNKELEELLKEGEQMKEERTKIPSVPPKIKIRPDVVKPGKKVKLVGEGFTPNSRLTVLFDGNPLARLNVGIDGTIKERLRLPEEVVKGAHQISVSDAEGRAANIAIKVEIDIQIVPLTVNVERQAYKQGDLVRINGTGKPGSPVQLTVKNPTGLAILSIAVPVDKEGNYFAFIPLSEAATPGDYKVMVSQEQERFETSYVVQTLGAFDLTVITDKFEYMRGENVKVSGKALPNKDVTVMIFGPNASELLNTVVSADNTGIYGVSMPISRSFALGEYSAVVKVDDEEIAISFTVVAGTVSLSVQTDKESYGDGELVRISGKGKANDRVTLIIKTPTEDEIKMSAITKDDGTYTALWLVSSVTKGGKYEIIAQQGDEIAKTAFAVAT